jgi:hypothetical protein
MSTAKAAVEQTDQDVEAQFEAFTKDLTELSLKHKIGIAGDPVLFVLEDIDLDRVYTCDADSRLTY